MAPQQQQPRQAQPTHHQHNHEQEHEHKHHQHSHAHQQDKHAEGLATTDDGVVVVVDAQQQEVLRRLKLAMLLCGSFLVIEVIGGYWAGSLAVLSDAAHLFADLASFAVAIAAAHLAALPTTDQHTFGLKRAESLAALLSMISLALVSLYLAAEAIRRCVWPDPENGVNGKLMSQVAAIGVLVNLALAWVLGAEHHIHLPGAHDHAHDHDHGGCGSGGHDHGHNHAHDAQTRPERHSGSHEHSHEHSASDHDHDHHDHAEKAAKEEGAPLLSQSNAEDAKAAYEAIHADELLPSERPEAAKQKKKKQPLKNINLQAAYLHVVGDLLQSLGVLIAGLAIWYNPKWTLVDPICTLFFCAIVFYSTLGVLRHSTAVLLQEVPPHLSWQRIYQAILAVEGISNVHDLHVWSISHDHPALAVHCSCRTDVNPETAMRQICAVLQREMKIDHVTIQMQQGNGPCITCQNNQGCEGKERLSVLTATPPSIPGMNEV